MAPTLHATSSFGGLAVDRDDRLGAGQFRAHHSAQSNAAQADDRNRVSRAYARRIDHGADAGYDRAAEQRRIRERHVLVDDDHVAAIDHRVLGHAREPRMMADALAVQSGDATAAGHQFAGRLGYARPLADLRPPLDAAPAAAAGPRELKHHVVAGAHIVDGRSDLDDFAGPFVTQCHRHRARTIAVDHRQVRMTQPRTGDAHQQFNRLGRREIHFLDRQWLGLRVGARRAYRAQNRGFAAYRHDWYLLTNIDVLPQVSARPQGVSLSARLLRA